MSCPIEMAFAHSYACAESELSAPYEVRHFPPAAPAGNDGLLFEIAPSAAASWTGLFARGKARGISRVMSLPDPSKVCVISGGHGYIVNCETPELWQNIEIDPIKQAISVISHQLVILAGYTCVVAIGAVGPVWNTGPIAVDGLVLSGIAGDDLLVVCDGETSTTIRVDLATGRTRELEPR